VLLVPVTVTTGPPERVTLGVKNSRCGVLVWPGSDGDFAVDKLGPGCGPKPHVRATLAPSITQRFHPSARRDCKAHYNRDRLATPSQASKPWWRWVYGAAVVLAWRPQNEVSCFRKTRLTLSLRVCKSDMAAQSDRYLRTIGQIWGDQYPPPAPRRHSLIEKLLATPIVFVRSLSLDNASAWFEEDKRHTFMDLYVLVFAFMLTTALFVPDHFWFIGVLIAAYRVADIVTYRLYFLLVKSQARPWTAAALRRSLVIVVVNFYETIVGYAILYLSIGRIVATNASLQQPLTARTAFYYSTVTAVTLGYGDYVPGNDFSRMLVVSQLFCTILFLIFVIPALVSLFSAETSSC